MSLIEAQHKELNRADRVINVHNTRFPSFRELRQRLVDRRCTPSVG